MTETPVSPTELDLSDKAGFRHWHGETLRFCDEDRFGHINNAVFATFCESGRVAYMRTLAERFGGQSLDFVVARLTINFKSEAHYPGTVEIGTRPVRVGRSSLTYGQGLFKDDVCIATAETVGVRFNVEKGETQPIEDELRRYFEQEMRADFTGPGPTIG